ncbi:MAG: radical SAM protein [Candidatus Latescibacter sp.]|nr:radical SAM protein [Candidatus Latescibacter sp.]
MSRSIGAQIQSLKSDKSVMCIRPWTSLEERSLVGDYQVCCWINSILGIVKKNSDTDIMPLWNNDTIRQIRRSFADGTFRAFCPDDCPMLIRKREFEPDFVDIYSYDPWEYDRFSEAFRSNCEKVIASAAEKRLVSDAFPLRLKIHPSNICNLDCRMCNLDKGLKEEVGEGYYRNIYRLMPFLEEIVIFGGEPFACKVSRDLIFGEEIRKHPQIHLSTITNGSLLDDKVMEKLEDLRLGWFSFSLDSCSEKTYPGIRVNAKYEKTFRNLKRFVEKRDRGEIRIRDILANFAIQATNYREIGEFIEYTHSLGIRANFTMVTGTFELLDRIDEVEACLRAGAAKAEALGEKLTAVELVYLLKKLPDYAEKLRKQRMYFKLFKIVDREKVVSFFQKHNRLKKTLRKIIGI